MQPEKFEITNPFMYATRTLLEGMKSKVFWLLAGSFFICGLSTSGLIGTHFVSYCFSFGIPIVTGATILSFMGVFDLRVVSVFLLAYLYF